MHARFFRSLGLSFGVAVFAAVALSAAVDQVSRRDAARLQSKIDRISKHVPGSGSAAGMRTPVTEAEVNSYLRYEMADKLPTGVTDPRVSILGNERLAGSATVDLGRVTQGHKSTGVLDPYNYLSGSVPITARGVLKSKSGVATFALESAAVSGVPVPVWMLQEIVSYYSKSASAPQGVTIEKPFALPAGIREIQIDPGQATVIQ